MVYRTMDAPHLTCMNRIRKTGFWPWSAKYTTFDARGSMVSKFPRYPLGISGALLPLGLLCVSQPPQRPWNLPQASPHHLPLQLHPSHPQPRPRLPSLRQLLRRSHNILSATFATRPISHRPRATSLLLPSHPLAILPSARKLLSKRRDCG